jgi:hypothetical protein
MTTKAEDVRAIAEKIRLGKYGLDTLFEAQKLIREYADLLDQQAKGVPVSAQSRYVGKLDSCRTGWQNCSLVHAEKAKCDVVDVRYLYTHPSTAQADPVK